MCCMDTHHINNVSSIDTFKTLRRQAEAIISGQIAQSTANLKVLSPAVVLKLMHELQVYQIELEMQNEELRKSQLALELTQARYFDLYDLAPISYCTANEQGVILEANLATTELLGETRSELVGKLISHYISKEYQDDYYHCRRRLYETGERQSCELKMLRPDGEVHWVYLTITAVQDNVGNRVQRVVLTDITEAKFMSGNLLGSNSGLCTCADHHSQTKPLV